MALEVVPLTLSKQDRRRFLRAGVDHYRGDRNFVPALESDLLHRTDPDRNPFFAHAEVDHLLVRRDGRDVGRAAAIRNRLAEEFRGDRTGYFGWFECAQDGEAARALLASVKERLAGRGCESWLGPVSYSTNDECGLLVEGFDGPPVLMMAYNPPWYEGMLREAGLLPAEDLLAWDTPIAGFTERERVTRVVERARLRHGWSLRPIRMDRFTEDLETVRGIYNRAWEANWGFVPMTAEEFRFAAEDLRRIVEPDLVLLAEKEGRAIGFSLSLPDFNQVLRRVGGSLFPLGWAKALWYSRRIDWIRIVAMGIVPEARNQGIEAGLILETTSQAAAHGYRGGKSSWTLGRNTAINRVMEMVGGRAYRKYRLFQGSTGP